MTTTDRLPTVADPETDAPRRTLRIVAVSGSPTSPSRTSALVSTVADAFAERLEAESRTIELAGLLGELAQGTWRNELGPNAQAALDAVEQADLLVVGSPAYRATYTGLFKLFFDHIGQHALVDTPVMLTATGGSDRHALLVEHQMRPLFGFFQALTVPLGIYGSEGDFEDYQVSSPELTDRIATAVQRTVPVVAQRLGLPGAVGPQFARPDAF